MTMPSDTARALVIKTSSLGDVVHTLAAATDAARAIPDIRFDWVVEESLAVLPRLHPAVQTVIPVAIRRWRRRPLRILIAGEYRCFRRALRATRYDAILDAQGLLKSALIAYQARGIRYGPGWDSAREPIASLAYHHHLHVAKHHHAVTGLRKLFSDALGYPMPTSAPDFGIDPRPLASPDKEPPFVLFLHGTHWRSKQWPERYWATLANRLDSAGLQVWLPHASSTERRRAESIANSSGNVRVLPRLNLSQLTGIITSASGVVGVDTGLAHLAAALAVPVVVIYGATSAHLTGALGTFCTNIAATFPCSPCKQRACHYPRPSSVTPACYGSVTPDAVAHALQAQITQARHRRSSRQSMPPPPIAQGQPAYQS